MDSHAALASGCRGVARRIGGGIGEDHLARRLSGTDRARKDRLPDTHARRRRHRTRLCRTLTKNAHLDGRRQRAGSGPLSARPHDHKLRSSLSHRGSGLHFARDMQAARAMPTSACLGRLPSAPTDDRLTLAPTGRVRVARAHFYLRPVPVSGIWPPAQRIWPDRISLFREITSLTSPMLYVYSRARPTDTNAFGPLGFKAPYV